MSQYYLKDVVMNVECIATISLWISNSIYTLAFFPQIILNYKRSSTAGLHPLMVFLYTAGYFSFLFYIFACCLPASYRYLVPLQCVLCCFIAAQQIYYSSKKYHLYYAVGYGSLTVLYGIVLPYAYYSFPVIGYYMGGVSVFLWSIYQIPQLFLMHNTRSTQGLSFWFLTFLAVGIVCELIPAIFLKLPIWTLLISLRGLIGYIFFCIQFIIYNK